MPPPAMAGVYDEPTCEGWPLVPAPGRSSAAPDAAAKDDADAPFAPSVGVAAGRERRLLLAGLRGRAGAVPLA
jgi:hypothetical protein